MSDFCPGSGHKPAQRPLGRGQWECPYCHRLVFIRYNGRLYRHQAKAPQELPGRWS